MAPRNDVDDVDADVDVDVDDYANLSMLERLLLRFNKRVELNFINNLEGRFLCEQIIEIYTKLNDVDKADEFAKTLASINDTIKELIEHYMNNLVIYLNSSAQEIEADNIASQVNYLENNCAYFGVLYHGNLYNTYGLIFDYFHKRNENENADIYAKLRDQYKQIIK